jgi:IS5 family transposase
VERIFSFTKVRYRGIARNANRLFVACALANQYMIRQRLLRMQGRSVAKIGKNRCTDP